MKEPGWLAVLGLIIYFVLRNDGGVIMRNTERQRQKDMGSY